MEIRRHIEVSGIVQGVGFRPYVYRLAIGNKLAGHIRNTSAGVAIEVQGHEETVNDFVQRLCREAPPLAHITEVDVKDVPCSPESDFRILKSRGGEEMRTLISADVAICPDCLREMRDVSDRRYRYPFINCTNCGPRFTIVRDIPYDRARTSMSVFPMCPRCQAEYDDPLNRRFHAQPNACWDCGPQLELWDKAGQRIPRGDAIAEAAASLHAGLVIAVKGLGGFHLAVDATNRAAVMLLRERKRRIEKPFAIMAATIEAAGEICEIDEDGRRALESVERPIVLLRKKQNCGIAEAVAPRNKYLGVFLPYTPLHHLLLEECRLPALVMTSGNLSEEPIAIDNREAVARLAALADYFMVHNRDILLRCDDSVVRIANGKTRQLRRSRGFVPVPVFLKEEQPPILAVGGELKNTVCIVRGAHAFLSQHIGDLENAASYKFFGEAVGHFKNLLEIEPEIVAYDLHPDYFSTKWARDQNGMHLVGVQHHHAHIASCMAENHLDARVIGMALDGTGYGTDGHIWGGEVLIATYEDFERAAHFEYVALPGGAAAIREPWRMALSYLVHHFGRECLQLPIPFFRNLDRKKAELVIKMIEQNINSLLTSSCGRLFDAVAALAGIREQINYEAQAAIELEMSMTEPGEDAYSFAVTPAHGRWIITTQALFESMVADLKAGVPAEVISLRFHNGLVHVLARVAELIRDDTGLNLVCLSGGTFNNVYLSDHLESLLKVRGFEVFTHSEVPAGDGGLSLGQAMVAAHRVRRVSRPV